VRENEDHWEIPSFHPARSASHCGQYDDLNRHSPTACRESLKPHHVDIAEVYDRHDYFEEKKIALTRWAEYLKTVLANKKPKVVPLRGKHDRREQNTGRNAVHGLGPGRFTLYRLT